MTNRPPSSPSRVPRRPTSRRAVARRARDVSRARFHARVRRRTVDDGVRVARRAAAARARRSRRRPRRRRRGLQRRRRRARAKRRRVRVQVRDVSPRRLDRARVRRARARAGRERVRVAVRADARVVDEGAGTSHANPVRGGHIAGVRGDGTDAGERGDGERDGVGKPDARAGAVRRADGTSVDVRVQRNARESGKGRVRAEWDIGVRHRDAQRHRTGWIPEGDGGTRGRGFFGLAGAAQVRGERRA